MIFLFQCSLDLVKGKFVELRGRIEVIVVVSLVIVPYNSREAGKGGKRRPLFIPGIPFQTRQSRLFEKWLKSPIDDERKVRKVDPSKAGISPIG